MLHKCSTDGDYTCCNLVQAVSVIIVRCWHIIYYLYL